MCMKQCMSAQELTWFMFVLSVLRRKDGERCVRQTASKNKTLVKNTWHIRTQKCPLQLCQSDDMNGILQN